MLERFRISLSNKDSHVMLTKTDNVFRLLKMSKYNGEVVKKLNTDHEKPECVTNKIDNVLYFLSDNQTSSIFKI